MYNVIKQVLMIFILSCFSQMLTSQEISFGDIIVISDQIPQAYRIFSLDVDNDGDLDIISASQGQGRISWFENIDSHGNFSSEQIIATGIDGLYSVYSEDIDGDGDFDFLSAAYWGNEIAWYENLNGLGNFSSAQIISSDINSASTVFSVDIDGDEDNDVITVSFLDGIISWFENIDGLGTFDQEHIISTIEFGTRIVYSIDIDCDSDYDIIVASNDKITWYENLDGLGNFGQQNIITNNVDLAYSLYCSDLDGDNDLDILSASWNDNKIAWYKNLNGSGNFSQQMVISTNAIGASSVFSADIDNDGDQDVLSTSYDDNKIAYYENLDGWGGFAQQQIITQEFNGPSSVFCSDIDGDGDQDILAASYDDNMIFWISNDLVSVIEYPQTTPEVHKIMKIFPNPFNPDATISFDLKHTQVVQIKIFNILGQLVKEIINDQLTRGNHKVIINNIDLSSGVYFLNFNGEEISEQRKIVILK